MAYNPSGRTAPRASRAYSIISEDSYAATPRPTPPPATRRAASRALRANSAVSDVPTHVDGGTRPPTTHERRIAAHYTLPPTVPSPFTGTLEASLDAVLAWGHEHTNGTQKIVNALLREVDSMTNWPILLRGMLIDCDDGDDEATGRGRRLLEELLFLVTRTLLPEQIAENRAAMARLYDRKKQLAIRLVLRYDMLREWKVDASYHPFPVPSLPPPPIDPAAQPVSAMKIGHPPGCSTRRPLMSNVIATLIAAPPGGFTTHGVRERMKHYITDLDDYLLLSDDKAAAWSDLVLIGMTSQIVLQWQWLRQNNEMLQEMEVQGWEELDCKADECDWIADDIKKPSGARKEKGSMGIDVNELV
ncbi:uncharacterized protein K460DRAFT_405282 [Cucurbitaria berberidis CBS 394.84]|uniref:Uncharacterized protein n=1 Tax=Cucurbitaria berberidis CBS 394.84 TaxID=1168544 RepID=A0A9P4L858_9PLEO|nr:uncharacterized protein K460DRAFT_405282 [Cucurbitaria berberidis CBS 394.84]KAF1845002.1 hypothetical protein K460DRAFT_405282 [Cucurbitaria berberidis CBS 394.84]